MSEIYGIDFGTTNSAVVGLLHGRSNRYGDDAGAPFPSLVAIDRWSGKVISRGREAWQHRNELADTCDVITSVKSYLGSTKTWNIGTSCWTATDVAREIFHGLKDQVAKRSQDPLEKAIVSIPVGFHPAKRKALRNAAEEADIQIVDFVSEPTAAVYKHYEDVKKWHRVAVLDWGGGTLDFSLVELSGNKVEEIETSGLPLGGDNIDNMIARWAHGKFIQNRSDDIAFEEMDSKYQDALLMKCEEAKRLLGNDQEEIIYLQNYGPLGAVDVVISRENLATILEEVFQSVVNELRAVFKRARLSTNELGCVLMVGGSSMLHGLYERMAREFDCAIERPGDDADWHVAHGAALLNKYGGNYVLSQNVGLLLSDDTFFPILKKGERANGKKEFLELGLVEDMDHARLVFLEAKDVHPEAFRKGLTNPLGYLSVPTFGFTREPIKLSYSVSPDLLLEVKAVSNHMTNEETANWEYGELRFCYELPRGNN